MAVGKTNASGGGTGGKLTITAPSGVTVTAAKDGKSYTRTTNAQGMAVFKGLSTGLWSVTISDGEQQTTQNVQITADYSLVMAFFAAVISVTYPAGSVCTCAKGITVLTAPDTSGSAVFTVPEAGDWQITCTDGSETASQTVSIAADGEEKTVSLSYQLYLNDFDWASYGTLGVDYAIVDDTDADIPQSEWGTAKNWKARLLTGGTVTALKEGRLDVFLVGGATGSGWTGSGQKKYGRGGSYEILLGHSVTPGQYDVVIGAGTTSGYNDGGNTSAFGTTALGGEKVSAGLASASPRIKEFNEPENPGIYEYSGSLGEDVRNQPGPPNTGTAGTNSGGESSEKAGGSGIVVIRNARGAA